MFGADHTDWQTYGAQRGLVFRMVDQPGMFNADLPTLSGTFNGVPFHIDRPPHQRTHNTHTQRAVLTRVRAMAQYQVPGTLRLGPEASFQGFFASLAGAHDVQLGDPAFDPQFNVIAHPDDRIAHWILDPHSRRALVSFKAMGPSSVAMQYFGVAAEGITPFEVSLLWNAAGSGVEKNFAVLDAAVSTVATLARAR